MLNRKTLLASLIIGASFTMVACDDNASSRDPIQVQKTLSSDSSKSVKKQTALSSLAELQQKTSSFITGPRLREEGAYLYVFFDPQCPHCNKLWQNAQNDLVKDASIVWIPVAFINDKSLPQGATILSSGNSRQTMAEHEKSMSEGGTGIAVSSVINPAGLEKIRTNNIIFESIGGNSVPLVFKASSKGEILKVSGELTPEFIKDFASK